ncbi:hypothetical protein JOD63_002805 [Microbacterium terrae]|nr:hypothetical protein [Microbacterium terrae]
MGDERLFRRLLFGALAVSALVLVVVAAGLVLAYD